MDERVVQTTKELHSEFPLVLDMNGPDLGVGKWHRLHLRGTI